MAERPCALVSMCLLGVDCRYDGGTNACDLAALAERCELVPVCPEQLGGLPTPRTPAERLGDRVIAKDGGDVTEAFHRGAAQACRLAERFGAGYALLKARSPSCGVHEIYDGTFTGTRVPGRGVTAEALRAIGVRVYDEREIEKMLEDMERDAL